MTNTELHSQQLNASERLALTWTLLWPYLLLDALMHESHHIAAAFGISVGGLKLPATMLDLFVVFPWAVRRALRARYSGFRFDIVRTGGKDGDRMNYGASLSVAWLLTWRFAAIIVVVSVPFAVAWKVSRGSLDGPTHESLATDLLGWLIAAPIQGGLYFWLLGGALRKQYRKFSIRIHRTGVVTPRFSPFVRGVAR